MVLNNIFHVEGHNVKSVLFTETEMWLSDKTIRDIESFEKKVNNPGMLDVSAKISFDSIKSLSFKNGERHLSISYTNEKGNSKKEVITFEDEASLSGVTNYLTTALNMQESVTDENKLTALLYNLLPLAIVIGLTIFLGTMESSEEIDVDSVSRRSRSGAAIMRWLHDTLGSTGIIIAGSIISLYLIYNTYNNYKRPKQVITWSK